VREQADTAVNVPFLDTILFLLGIPGEEIAELTEQKAADGSGSDGPEQGDDGVSG
jgi:phosphoserine phosphatase